MGSFSLMKEGTRPGTVTAALQAITSFDLTGPAKKKAQEHKACLKRDHYNVVFLCFSFCTVLSLSPAFLPRTTMHRTQISNMER